MSADKNTPYQTPLRIDQWGRHLIVYDAANKVRLGLAISHDDPDQGSVLCHMVDAANSHHALVDLLNRVFPDDHTINTGVSPKEARALLATLTKEQ